MIRVSQIRLSVGHTEEQFRKKLSRMLHIREQELKGYEIKKRSLDSRKKPELYYVYTADVSVDNEERVLKQAKGKAQKVKEKEYRIPVPQEDAVKLKEEERPVVIGSGPAGLFCAYLLALRGFCPLVLERGASVHERKKDVENFWETGVLDPASNVQFGEGGAGTFSDGKLNTLVKDPAGRNRFVLETFVKSGAPEDILWEQKPHIGTDILIRVVESMRKEIISLGGEFRFHAQVTDLIPEDHTLIINGKEKVQTPAAVLAVGHSARDTFRMILDRGIRMEAKSFAVGVRVEHPQSLIDENTYGKKERGALPAASYKLAEKLENGRGVYTFCMCPGGYVVNASSEEHMLAVNGMSYHGRNSANANSAVIVTVTPEDFGDSHPLAGVEFQRSLERRAWEAGSGKIPVQRFGDFEADRIGREFGSVTPCMKGAYQFGDVRHIFPDEIGDSIIGGIRKMDRKIHGFADPDTLLSGVESRTSSPVRIVRDSTFKSSLSWIYPCGEGAGYAGGITSAAMDGMKVAEAVIKEFRPGMFTEI